MESHIDGRTYSGSESESEEETTKLLFPVNGLSSLFISVNNVNALILKVKRYLLIALETYCENRERF